MFKLFLHDYLQFYGFALLMHTVPGYQNEHLQLDNILEGGEMTHAIIKSIPNIITISRLFFLSLLFTLEITPENIVSVMLLVYLPLMLGDRLDGLAAKLLNAETKLGVYLDPIVDKICEVSLVCFFVGSYGFPKWLAILVLFRNTYSTHVRTAMNIYGEKDKGASHWGKIKTAVIGICFGAFLLESVAENALNEYIHYFYLGGFLLFITYYSDQIIDLFNAPPKFTQVIFVLITSIVFLLPCFIHMKTGIYAMITYSCIVSIFLISKNNWGTVKKWLFGSNYLFLYEIMWAIIVPWLAISSINNNLVLTGMLLVIMTISDFFKNLLPSDISEGFEKLTIKRTIYILALFGSLIGNFFISDLTFVFLSLASVLVLAEITAVVPKTKFT